LTNMASKVAPAGKNAPAAKKASEPQGQYTWRVRRKMDGSDTPWKSGGPGEIMEVVLRRLEVLEGFEKSTKEIERRINNLDKNILAVAKEIMPEILALEQPEQFMPKPVREPTPPPAPKTIMPRPPPPPKPVEEPVVAKKAAAPASKPAPAAAVAAPGAIKKSFKR